MTMIHHRHASASEAFHEVAAAVLVALPPGISRQLTACRVSVVTTGRTLDARPDLRGSLPSVEPLAGLYDRGLRQAVLPEWIVDLDGERPAFIPDGVLRHELGHALDHCLGNMSQTRRMRSAYARGAEFAADLDAAGELGYYLHEGVEGRREAFAEAVAVALGGGAEVAHPDLFQACFRELIDLVTELVR
jgi:hypothetical protein